MVLYEKKIRELVEDMRPPAHIRHQVDVGYSYKAQALEIYESRPQWNNNAVINQHPFAKAKFNKSQNVWKIYWRRASGKWELYEQEPEVNSIEDFFRIINEDKLHVFRG